MEVVINKCHGGFGLSDEAIESPTRSANGPSTVSRRACIVRGRKALRGSYSWKMA